MQSGISAEVVEQIVELLFPKLSDAIGDGISAFFGELKTQVTEYLEGFFWDLLDPMVRTPAPEGPRSSAPVDIAFESATNAPWDSLISNIYFDAIVGLALGLQFIVLSMIGLRYGSMNPVVRKKLLRRLGVAFLSLFFWLPVASIGTQLFDAIGKAIYRSGYSETEAAATISSAAQIAELNLGVFLILIVVGMYVYLKAVFIFVARWLLVFLLTLSMPLVATFWAVEVWPLNRFSGLAKQVAGAYPGVLAAGIPPAILIRMSLEATNWGLSSDLSLFISLVTLLLAAKSQKLLIQRSSQVAIRVSEQTLAGAKKPAKVGTATAGAAATLGAGAAGGAGAARSVGGTLTAASSAAKGRVSGAAMGAQMVHRQMAANDSGSSSSGESSDGNSSGSEGGSWRSIGDRSTGGGSSSDSDDGGDSDGGPGASPAPSNDGGSGGSSGAAAASTSGNGASVSSSLNSKFVNPSSNDGVSARSPDETADPPEEPTEETIQRPTMVRNGDTEGHNTNDESPFINDDSPGDSNSPSDNGSRSNDVSPNHNGSGGSDADSSESLRDALATDDDTLGPDAYRDL